VSPKTGRAVCAKEAKPYESKLLEIPSFMTNKDFENNDIEKGLKLTGYFLVHRLLQYSTFHTLPQARIQLENFYSKN
jgi:DNA repair protein RecO (recombination protein O)